MNEPANRDKASLDIFWLRDESLEESDNLPNSDVLAQEIVAPRVAPLGTTPSQGQATVRPGNSPSSIAPQFCPNLTELTVEFKEPPQWFGLELARIVVRHASGLIARCSFSLSSQGDLGQTKSAFVRALFSFFHDSSLASS